MKQVSCKLLVNSLEELKLSINSLQLSRITLHLDLLIEWNKKTNLTSITDEREIIIKHVLDSVVLATKIDLSNYDAVADIGTGAGFPGIPLKILNPNMSLSLIESSQKKAEFLVNTVSELQLEKVYILNDRVENIANNEKYREKYSLAISRAVADIAVLVEYALPLVKVGGCAVFYKAKTVFDELKEASYAIELLGGRVEEIARVVVPFLNAERYLVLVEKVGQSPQKYPRKAGSPAKRPLRM